jgi:hypothetical protein
VNAVLPGNIATEGHLPPQPFSVMFFFDSLANPAVIESFAMQASPPWVQITSLQLRLASLRSEAVSFSSL